MREGQVRNLLMRNQCSSQLSVEVHLLARAGFELWLAGNAKQKQYFTKYRFCELLKQ